MLDRVHLVEYLRAIQKREITNFISIVNSNTQALKKITKDIEIIKKSTLKKSIISSSTFFKNALLRVSQKFVSTFKHNEIIIKLKKNTTNFIREKKKKKLIRSVNTYTKKNEIQNINIKTINKFSNENVVIQTRNLKKTLKLKKNHV